MSSALPEYHGDEIAIVGLACRFPGAANIEEYWHNLRNGVHSITFFTDDELRELGIPQEMLAESSYVKARGVLADVDQFDAAFFDFTPREAEFTEPQQRIFLECAWNALERAGYDPYSYPAKVGLFAGVGMSTYSLNFYVNSQSLSDLDKIQLLMGNDKDFLCTRTSYKLNLKGPSLTVQTACSSSLVATHLACQSLLNGESDLALAGGVSIALPQQAGYQYQEGGILSPDGYCRAFDAQARGTVIGSGAGVVVLKRLDDALNDGDTIYAVIKGSAINNDGSLKVGYTAPSVQGQADVIAEALSVARVEPETIRYIETHGTGTPIGDPIEISALTRAFSAHTSATQFCAIGSVKTNIGHMDAAAGVAGLIKTALALHHKQIPPSLHFAQPNPQIDFAHSPFYVQDRLADWPAGEHPRRAGVSAFGIGGTNVHLVVEEAPELPAQRSARPHQLLLLSAKTPTALDRMTENLIRHCHATPELDLADVAYTLQTGRSGFAQRRAIVCSSGAALDLGAQRSRTALAPERPPALAFVFPGIGEHYPGMAREIYAAEPVFREVVDRCCALLEPQLGCDLRTHLFPPQNRALGESPQIDLRQMIRRQPRGGQSAEPLQQTALAQPAVFVIEYALAQLLRAWGLKPSAMLGYSLGEYVAACLAGVLSLEDALRLVAARARMIQELPPGSMLAVALSVDEIRPFLSDAIQLAAVNSPLACVVAGEPAAIQELAKRLTVEGIVCRVVETTHAFHTTLLKPAVAALTDLASSLSYRAPEIPYLSNVTGTWITPEQATDPSYWASHMCQTVQFAQGVGQLAQRASLILEVGPAQTLGSFIKQHPAAQGERPAHVLPTLPGSHMQQSDYALLLDTLGQLWLSGVAIDWARLWSDERRRRVPLPTYPFERQRFWLEAGTASAASPTARARPDMLGRAADPSDWFYVPEWHRTLIPGLDSPAETGVWLVFMDELGITQQLSQRLREEGHQVISVRLGTSWRKLDERSFSLNPQQPDDYAALIGALRELPEPPTHILHGWALNPPVGVANGDRFEGAQTLGFYSLLSLTRALTAGYRSTPLNLLVLTEQAQLLPGDSTSSPERSTLLGAVTVINQEYPHIRSRAIDLPLLAPDEPLPEFLAGALYAELFAHSSDLIAAYRGRTRWVKAYEPLPIEALPQPTSGLRAGGVYLITGGLGNMGLSLAHHLAERVQARLVLISRSALPPQAEWPALLASGALDDRMAGRLRRLQELSALGAELLVLQADAADREQMSAAVEQTIARFGTLNGVIHTAGATGAQGYQLIQELTPNDYDLHFRPKVRGLYVLDQVLRGLDLDFCLICSSIASVLGGLGLSVYAAANLFMDAFVQQRQLRDGSPWISVNWDSWQFQPADGSGEGVGATLAPLTMTPDEGVDAFQRIVGRARGIPQVVQSLGNLDQRIAQWVQLEAVRAGQRREASHPRPVLGQEYLAPRTPLEQQLAEIWQEVLGISQVGVEDNFFELGGNSLIALQVIARARDALAVDLSLRELFDLPTVAGMAKQVEGAQRITPARRGPSIRALPRG